MVGADEFGMDYGHDPDKTRFEQEVASGDTRRALIAMRDLAARELSGKRCKTCMMSQLRSGEQAALLLRLEKIIEAIKNLPDEEEVSELDRILSRRGEGVPEA